MDRPKLEPLEIVSGAHSAFVILRGLASESKFGVIAHQVWIQQLRAAGFEGSIYQYWWDSSHSVFHYVKVKSRAKEVGRSYLANDLLTLKEPYINIIAHSMGCRIPYHMLKIWNERNEQHPLQKRLHNCIFLGGHIKRDCSRAWHLFPRYFFGQLFNCYNPKDKTLKRFHKTVGRLDKSSCGRKPIEYSHSRLINVEINTIGSSHSQYINVLSNYLFFPKR